MQTQTEKNPQKFQTNTQGITRIINAAKFSYDGLIACWQKEAAFRQLVMLHTVLIIVIFSLNFSKLEQALLVFISVFSLVVELLNSAIEACIDRISLDIHPLSKIAKDLGSAAQIVTLSMIFAIWLILLFA